ncbi:MAG: response regulator [Cyanobacteriota/Melainabacteria group bacterium]
MNNISILIVEDEPEIRRFLRVTLSNHGFTLYEATKGAEAIAMLESSIPTLVIMDLGLPDIDGVDLIKRVRDWSTVPIIVLSVRNMESDKIDALDAGADDFVTKPFGVFELMARIRVALRHLDLRDKGDEESSVFSVGDLKVDFSRREVFIKDTQVHLTPTEYKLLTMLAQNPGKVVSQESLLREVWGPGHSKRSHYLRVYMGNIRQKLEEKPARPRYIITEPGVGYRLKDD